MRGHGAGAVRRDLVHGLHRFDDEDGLALGDAGADGGEMRLAGLGRRDRRCRPWARSACPGWTRGHRPGRALARSQPGAEGVGRGRGWPGGRGRDHHLLDAGLREGAGDADAQIFALDLDLGEVLLVEQLGDGLGSGA